MNTVVTAIAPQKAKWRLPEPPKIRLREQFRQWMVTRHYSPATVACYVQWVLNFVLWSGKRDPKTVGASEVGAFLTHLANERHVTAKTQNQALCALVLFYDSFLEESLEGLV
jgi:site-specific recombinase XerD